RGVEGAGEGVLLVAELGDAVAEVAESFAAGGGVEGAGLEGGEVAVRRGLGLGELGGDGGELGSVLVAGGFGSDVGLGGGAFEQVGVVVGVEQCGDDGVFEVVGADPAGGAVAVVLAGR